MRMRNSKMFTAIDVSTSGLVAQRTRINVIAGNLANLSTTHNEAGEAKPYQPRYVTFQADPSLGGADGSAGVRVNSIEAADISPVWKFQPGHPDAIKQGERQGYVAYPGIDMSMEMVDAIEASRAYEANLGVIQVSKSLNAQSLKIVG
jgi:flagellar basal-body rod protein FlgC